MLYRHFTGLLGGRLRSKRFYGFGEQRKTSVFCLAQKWDESQNKKVRGGGGEGRKGVLTSPPLSLFYS